MPSTLHLCLLPNCTLNNCINRSVHKIFGVRNAEYINIVRRFVGLEVEVRRVPGHYPFPAGYCTTRHYPDPVGYYFKIWPDPDPAGNLSRFLRLSTITHAVKRKVGIYLVLRPSLMHDTMASRVAIITHLVLRWAGQMAI